MEKECKDRMDRQQARNLARRKQARKRMLLYRMAAITILIGVVIAVIFLLGKFQSGAVEKAESLVTESTMVGSSMASTSVVESQEEAAENTAADNIAAEASEPTVISEPTATLHDTPDTDGLFYPFNQVSADWSEENLKGWWRYTIPDEFKRTGGYLPDIVQVYTYSLCKQSSIRYSLALAIIEIESGYQYDALSDTNDIGYMQVNYKWQQDKMPDMTEKALYNPYVNIGVGIRYLAELSEEFSTEEAVLTAYHYGVSGAYSRCYQDASITSDYAEKVLEASVRIEEELLKREVDAKEK